MSSTPLPSKAPANGVCDAPAVAAADRWLPRWRVEYHMASYAEPRAYQKTSSPPLPSKSPTSGMNEPDTVVETDAKAPERLPYHQKSGAVPGAYHRRSSMPSASKS